MDIDKNKLPDDTKLLKQIIFDLCLKHEEERGIYEEELQKEREKYLTIFEQFNT